MNVFEFFWLSIKARFLLFVIVMVLVILVALIYALYNDLKK